MVLECLNDSVDIDLASENSDDDDSESNDDADLLTLDG